MNRNYISLSYRNKQEASYFPLRYVLLKVAEKTKKFAKLDYLKKKLVYFDLRNSKPTGSDLEILFLNFYLYLCIFTSIFVLILVILKLTYILDNQETAKILKKSKTPSDFENHFFLAYISLGILAYCFTKNINSSLTFLLVFNTLFHYIYIYADEIIAEKNIKLYSKITALIILYCFILSPTLVIIFYELLFTINTNLLIGVNSLYVIYVLLSNYIHTK